jgi:hypothetical protein
LRVDFLTAGVLALAVGGRGRSKRI